eukprot:6213775-Pleurochrysis_carterae.AAC.1
MGVAALSRTQRSAAFLLQRGTPGCERRTAQGVPAECETLATRTRAVYRHWFVRAARLKLGVPDIVLIAGVALDHGLVFFIGIIVIQDGDAVPRLPVGSRPQLWPQLFA